MRSTSALLASLICAALFTAGAQGQPQEGHHHHTHSHSAKSLLSRSMRHGRKIMVSAVVLHRPAHDPNREIELRVEQDGEGRVKYTSLSPQKFAGMVSLDDGIDWTTYDPNDRRIFIQTSPRVEEGNPVYQLALAVQNYTLTSEPAPPIADCQVVCVTASPNAKELNKRRYYLEERTSFMLRLETVSPEGVKTALLDTKSITFLKEPPSMDLGVDESKIPVERPHSPEMVSPPSQARPLVGFEPRTPDGLPMGFIIKETQVVGGGDDRFIAVRITDGLVHATVYQWRADIRWRREPPFARAGRYRQVGLIRLSLFGPDMPQKARDIVLAAFCK